VVLAKAGPLTVSNKIISSRLLNVVFRLMRIFVREFIFVLLMFLVVLSRRESFDKLKTGSAALG
jgi:hypothetical protein